jgi:hypothetical protein
MLPPSLVPANSSPLGRSESTCTSVNGTLPSLVTVKVNVTLSPTCPWLGLTELVIATPIWHGLL